MDKNSVIQFFDAHAASWDDELIRSEHVISRILSLAGIKAGESVLDVACGTGVLIDDYLRLGAEHVTGIDIAPEMVRIAAGKFKKQSRVDIICADVESVELSSGYDRIMVYNAFPHFPEPERLIERLASLLRPGGSLSVAHGQSREEIDRRHQGSAHSISMRLMEAESLAAIFEKHLRVNVCISDEEMYMVSGVREKTF